MTVELKGIKYYRTAEACRLAGITKNTYFRWVSNGSIPDVIYRDRRGWRLFSEEELASLKEEASRVRSL